MLVRLSWKNIWRNKVRSGVILGAIAIGLFAGTYLVAFMTGWVVDSAVTEIGNHHAHFQIHNKSFMANNDINAVFSKEDMEKTLKNCDFSDQLNISYRLSINGLLASASNVSGISLKAVNASDEKLVSNIWKNIPDTLGEFLPDNVRMPVVISQKTAEKLKVRLKSKIVFSFTDCNGDMQSLAFRVCGIFKTINPMVDEGKVFVRYEDICDITNLPPNSIHEAAITVKDLETCAILLPKLTNLFPDLDVKDWRTLSPMLAVSLDYMKYVVFIYIGIFLFALSFGIINTMLMAVLERTRELGMLGAIGMTKGRIFKMIMLETIFLTLLGSFTGIILAALVLIPSMQSGIDLTLLIGDSFDHFGFGTTVYPILNFDILLKIVILVIVASILSAIYPARKALKLKSLEAIRQ
ncbi:MAG: FtsX-like permease family protein [Bacteroidales bacterium]|jgi:ABC-type lipoprotein release transport system permease subunit|nr:FtsX-like permease family protein [Bacteroidales bacterium]